MNSKIISTKRSRELTSKSMEYLEFRNNILLQEDLREKNYQKIKEKILKYFNATTDDWSSYGWQMKHRITDVSILNEFISLSPQEKNKISLIAKINRFAIVPYYLALIMGKDKDPIKMQCIPSELELSKHIACDDPMAEEFSNPAGSITRRYPDRLIIIATNKCAMYCRHCQRRRLIKDEDYYIPKETIDESIHFIREHHEIRDVLITGGDALLLSDTQLGYILREIRSIKHVEIIRLGTRTPVTMPMRITDNLIKVLKRHHPIYVNTQYNHPFEITKESSLAIEKLLNAGIPVGNQSVLLKGINNDKYIMRYLCQKLLSIRVRPYYLFHAKKVSGTGHFITKIAEGLTIMEHLRGNTSGLAIPTYILNAPNGLGKIPLLPPYILDHKENVYTFKTWENKIITYQEDD